MNASTTASPSGRFGRRCRLRLRRDVRAVLRRGRRRRSDHLEVIAWPRKGAAVEPRLALSVARSAGHAPARARLRRLVRAAFRALRSRWRPGLDLMVVARTPWPGAGLADVAAELEALIGPIGGQRQAGADGEGA